MQESNNVKVGKIAGAKGLKGEVRIISYTQDPLAIKNYKVFDSEGRHYVMLSLQRSGKFLVAKLDGVNSRESAEQIKNTDLYALKSDFPPLEEDDFYYIDLEGLKVLSSDSSSYVGNVTAVYNFGADDILEFTNESSGKVFTLTFNKENFPTVNIKDGFIVVNSILLLGSEDNETNN